MKDRDKNNRNLIGKNNYFSNSSAVSDQQQHRRLQEQQRKATIKASMRMLRQPNYNQQYPNQGMENKKQIQHHLLQGNSKNDIYQTSKQFMVQQHILHLEQEQQPKYYNRVDEKNKIKLAKKFSRLQDKCFFMPVQSQKFYITWKRGFDKYLQEHKQISSLLSPQSYFLLIWNIFIAFIILFNLFQVPIALCFTIAVYNTQINTLIGFRITLAFLIILYIDTFFIRHSVPYYQNGKLITSRKITFYRFIKKEFWFDFISLLALTIYIACGNHKLIYIKVLFYLRIYSLMNIDQQIMHILEFYRIPFGLYRLARLIIFLWYLASIAGSIYFAIDYHYYLEKGYYYDNQMLWLTNSDAVGELDILNNFSWPIWYTYALYWSIQTASTVGYGDITPMNPPQVIFVVIIILIMTILFAFYLNSIWKIISTMSQNSVNSDKCKKVKQYFKQNKIGEQSMQKIQTYLYQIWQDRSNVQIQEQIINGKLSRQLKDLFHIQHKKVFYQHIPAFKMIMQATNSIQNLHHDLMKDLVNVISIHTVSQGNIIYSQGQLDPMLYFIHQGKIKLYIHGTLINELVPEHRNFGTEEFFKEVARTHTAEAVGFSKIWQLNYSDFKRKLQNYPPINEKFCELKSKLVFQKDQKILQLLLIKCWKCSSKSHVLYECPQINQWQDKLTVNKKNVFSYNPNLYHYLLKQKRKYFKRQKRRSDKKMMPKNQQKNNRSNFENVHSFKFFYPNFNIKP